MNNRIRLGLGVLALLIVGWLTYRWVRPATSAVGRLVPPDALIVLASNRLQDTVSEQALRTEVTLQQVPLFGEARQRLDQFLYATADTASAVGFVRGKDIRYSLHPVSKYVLDYLFYIPTTAADGAFLNRLTNPDPRRYRVLNHSFAGQKISDLVSRSNVPVGSFLLTDGFLVGSTSAILIENVAKRMRSSLGLSGSRLAGPALSESGFGADADHWAGLSVRPEVLQSLIGNAGSLIRLFLPEELNLQFRPAASQTGLIGYAADEIGNRRDVAALFAGQTPRRIRHADLIPQTTATLYHVGISDAGRFGRSMSTLLSRASGDFLRRRFGRIRAAADELYPALTDELLLCRLESPTGMPRQVLVLPARDARQAANAYQQAAFRAGAKPPAPPLTFLGHKVIGLNVAELPASLFSSLVAGFNQSWVTQHGSALIVASSEDAMQEYLEQLQSRATWSADSRQMELLTNTLRPANFTIYVRLSRLQTRPTSDWPVAWQTLVGEDRTAGGHESSLANLDNLAYQASYGNEKILSTLVLGRTARRASTKVLNKVLLQKRIPAEAPPVAAPIVVGNLSDQTASVLVQTAGNQLRLVTAEGEPIGQAPTDGPIRSNALAVDFLNNGRLQYLFMTDQRLYVADPGAIRPGRSAQPLPLKLLTIKLPNGLDPTHLAQPLGRRNADWVALAAHADGQVWALDRQRRTFVRWLTAPRKAPLLLPFQVLSTPAGMNVLAAQPDGTVNYWLEDGRQRPHFPARVERTDEEAPEVRFAGPVLLPASQTLIQGITQEGERFQLTLNGLLAGRTQLYRTVRSDVFRLFPDEEMTDWLLLRTTDTEATILDQRGQRRFDVRALQSGRNGVRYHRLGAGVAVISVQSGGFARLYDPNGRIIGDRPIPALYPPTLQFDERTNELYVLSAVPNAVQLFSIRLR